MYRTDPLPLPSAHDSAGSLSPAEFAKASGVSLSTVWRLLRRGEVWGRHAFISLRNIRSAAEF